MKQKYAIFAQDGPAVKFIRIASCRFARANHMALKENYLPGVFFSHFVGEAPDCRPVGEHHKPMRLSQAPVVKTGHNPDAGRTILDGTIPRSKRSPRQSSHARANQPLSDVDPMTGESLGDVYVDLIRRDVERKRRAANTNLLMDALDFAAEEGL